MTKIIVFNNQKGGVGKTTSAITVASGLALKGKKVLIVDLDPQGHAATSLGINTEPGAFYLLTMGMGTHETMFLQQFVRDTGRPNLSLIAGNQETNAAQMILNAKDQPVSWIKQSLARFNNKQLDYIVIDTSPSVGGIQERALWAGDLVVVPTSPEYLSTDSVVKTVEMMKTLQTNKVWKGKLLGILPTMLHQQINEHKAALADLRTGFGEMILKPIHRAAVLAECPGEAKTIWEKAPDSRAAEEYEALVQLVIRHS